MGKHGAATGAMLAEGDWTTMQQPAARLPVAELSQMLTFANGRFAAANIGAKTSDFGQDLTGMVS